jgi:hypothetical protein
MSGTNRLKREMESRELQERPKQWQEASLLPEPDKEPGFAYRWVRVSTLNMNDPRNLSGKLREGWEPVSVEEQPTMKLLADPNSRFVGNIEIGGLLLCKTPVEFVDQRNSKFREKSEAQTLSVDNNFMRQSDSRMPLFAEKKSTTSFGRGS